MRNSYTYISFSESLATHLKFSEMPVVVVVLEGDNHMVQSFASWLSNAECKCEEAVVTSQ